MVQFTEIPELAGTPLVVDLVDVDSQKWFDYAAASSGWKKWLFNMEARRVRRLESSLAQRADAVTLVSDAEADIYRSFCPNGKTHAVFNGVDLDYFRPDFPVEQREPNECVFVGVLDYRANVESLIWFCDMVWPHVKARRPEAVFCIVGKNPTTSIRALAARAGIRLVGEVPDVRPYLAESRFSVAPLQIARGVQNKVLEAMAMGTPVIASPQALEGLAAKNGIHAVAASDPRDWQTAMCDLFSDDGRCQQLGREGRAYVEQHHHWDVCMTRLTAILDASHNTPLDVIRDEADQGVFNLKRTFATSAPGNNWESFRTTIPEYCEANQS
jgi:sugar transferase (PEP-CTERM/EpsH1 system associated)